MRLVDMYETINCKPEEKLAKQIFLTENMLLEKGYTSLERESRGRIKYTRHFLYCLRMLLIVWKIAKDAVVFSFISYYAGLYFQRKEYEIGFLGETQYDIPSEDILDIIDYNKDVDY